MKHPNLAILLVASVLMVPSYSRGQAASAIPRGASVPRGGGLPRGSPRGVGPRSGIPSAVEVQSPTALIGRAGVLRAGASAMHSIRGAPQEAANTVQILSRNGMRVGELVVQGESAFIRNATGEVIGKLVRQGGQILQFNSVGKQIGFSENTPSSDIIHFGLDAAGRAFKISSEPLAIERPSASAPLPSVPSYAGDSGSIILSIGGRSETEAPPFVISDKATANNSTPPDTRCELTIGGRVLQCVRFRQAVDQSMEVLSFNPTGNHFYGCTKKGTLITWDCRTGEIVREASLRDSQRDYLSNPLFVSQGRYLVAKFQSVSGEWHWGVWAMDSLAPQFDTAPEGAQTFAFGTTGRLAAYAYSDQSEEAVIDVVEVATTRIIRSFVIDAIREEDGTVNTPGRINSIAVNDAFNMLAVSSRLGTQIYSIVDGSTLKRYVKAHAASMKCSPDDKFLVSTSDPSIGTYSSIGAINWRDLSRQQAQWSVQCLLGLDVSNGHAFVTSGAAVAGKFQILELGTGGQQTILNIGMMDRDIEAVTAYASGGVAICYRGNIYLLK